MVLRRCALDQRADAWGAGEAEVPDAWMGGERGARLFAKAGRDVQRPGRQARLFRDGGEGEGGEAGLFGGFQHAGVAHGERSADRPANDLHRVVPGHNMACHAVGFAQGVDGVAVEIGDRFPHHLVRRAAIELQISRQCDGVRLRLFQRLADISGFDPRQRVGAIQHDAAHLHQHPPAFSGGRPAPFVRQRGFCGGDGGVYVSGGSARDLTDLGSVGGVLKRQLSAAFRRAPAAPDIDRVGAEPDIRMGVHIFRLPDIRQIVPLCGVSRKTLRRDRVIAPPAIRPLINC